MKSKSYPTVVLDTCYWLLSSRRKQWKSCLSSIQSSDCAFTSSAFTEVNELGKREIRIFFIFYYLIEATLSIIAVINQTNFCIRSNCFDAALCLSWFMLLSAKKRPSYSLRKETTRNLSWDWLSNSRFISDSPILCPCPSYCLILYFRLESTGSSRISESIRGNWTKVTRSTHRGMAVEFACNAWFECMLRTWRCARRASDLFWWPWGWSHQCLWCVSNIFRRSILSTLVTYAPHLDLTVILARRSVAMHPRHRTVYVLSFVAKNVGVRFHWWKTYLTY